MTHSNDSGLATSLRLLGAAVALCVAAGCNSDNVPSNDVGIGADADAGMTDTGTPDTWDDAGDIGLDVADAAETTDTVDEPPPREPSVPEVLIITLTPPRGVYPTGLRVVPSAEVYDQYAEVMPDMDVTWTVTPESAVTVLDEDEGYRLEREGEVTFRGCVPRGGEGSLSLCASRTIQVDAGAPIVEIFTPTPGQELLSDEDPMITVTGRATDTNGRVAVFVNGERANLDAEGLFEAEVRPIYGVNHIEVVASDGLQGLATVRAVDVMWAPHYYPLGAGEGGTVAGSYPDALIMRINQGYLDADEPVEIDPDEMMLKARDIAGLLEFVLQEIDVMAFIPESLAEGDAFNLSFPDATLGHPKVDIRVTRTGLEIFISMQDFVVETDGAISLTDEPISLDGSIGLMVSATVNLDVHKFEDEEDLVVDVTSVAIALENAEGDFETEGVGAVIELLEGLLFDSLEVLAIDAIEEAFLAELPVILEDALGSIDESLQGLTFDLDLGLGGDPVEIAVDAVMESVLPESRSGLVIDFGLDVGTSATPSFPDSRGAAMDTPFDQGPPLFNTSRLQIAARVPLLNGILHHLWDSSLLNIDATDLIPPELAFVIEGAQLSGKLPPHMTASRPDTLDYAFVLTLGQLEMEIWRQDRRDLVGINATVAANLDVVDNKIVLSIAEEPDIDMWLIEQLGTETLFDNIDALEGLFVGAIWPMVTEQIATGLEIELPALDLAAVGDLAPRLADLTMDLVLDHPVEVREGYIVIDGAFEGTADLSE